MRWGRFLVTGVVLCPMLSAGVCASRSSQGVLIPTAVSVEGTSRAAMFAATIRQRSTAEPGKMFSGGRAAEISYAAAAEPYEDADTAFRGGDYATALQLLRPLAGRGDTRAQLNLAYLYANGLGAPQDYSEAAKWFLLAAGQGNAAAQFNLGVVYSNGQGVPQNYEEAMKWFRLAAEQGDAGAQSVLGSLYANGQGMLHDYAEAAKWLRKAADQGNAAAQANLGVLYRDGQGMPQDYAEAAKWFRKAADQSVAEARYNLGAMYANGQGMPQNVVRALMWFYLSAAQGNQNAVKSRDIFTGHMTPAQITEAQKLAREWKPTTQSLGAQGGRNTEQN